MPNDIAYFRLQAERARAFADAAVQSEIRAAWTQLAKQFDYLADLAVRYGPRRDVNDRRA